MHRTVVITSGDEGCIFFFKMPAAVRLACAFCCWSWQFLLSLPVISGFLIPNFKVYFHSVKTNLHSLLHSTRCSLSSRQKTIPHNRIQCDYGEYEKGQTTECEEQKTCWLETKEYFRSIWFCSFSTMWDVIWTAICSRSARNKTDCCSIDILKLETHSHNQITLWLFLRAMGLPQFW